jgi:hypothetical protein
MFGGKFQAVESLMKKRYLEDGIKGLKNGRKNKYQKVADKDEKRIIQCKLEGGQGRGSEKEVTIVPFYKQ